MFDDMQKMMQRMQSIMDNSFGEAPLARPFLLPSGNVESRLTKTPSMALHVVEKPEGYEVQAELPGVKKEDIKVEVHDNQVAISARTASQQEKKEGERIIYSERTEGQVSRRFTLPVELDESKSEARFDNGVLTLSLVKRNGTVGPRQLSVS